MAKEEKTQEKDTTTGTEETGPSPTFMLNSNEFFPNLRSVKVNPKGTREYYPKKIEDKNLKFIFTRDEMGHRIATKVKRDVFYPWFTVDSDVKGLPEEFRKFNERLNVKHEVQQAWLLSKILRWSLISMDLEDDTDKLTETPTKITDITRIKAVAKTYVQDIVRQTDKTKPNYGEPLKYKVDVSSTSTQDLQFVPAERFIHIENFGLEADGQGISIYDPLYNTFVAKEVMDYSIFESLNKLVSPIFGLWYPRDAGKTEKAKVQNMWRDVDIHSMFSFPDDYKVQIIPTSQGMDPNTHIDYMMTRIGAGSHVGKVILAGTEGGKLSTSDFNAQEYDIMVKGEQKEYVEFYLRKLYSFAQKWGILPKGDYALNWGSVFKRDDKEIAEISKIEATTAIQIAKTLQTYAILEWPFVVHNSRVYVEKDGVLLETHLDGIEKKSLTTTSKEIGTAAMKLTDEERREILEMWQLKTERIEPDFKVKLTDAIFDYESDFLDEFRRLWEKEVGQINSMNQLRSALNMLYVGLEPRTDDETEEEFQERKEKTVLSRYKEFLLTNDTNDLISEILTYYPDTEQLQLTLDKYIDESYEEGYRETVIAMAGGEPGFIMDIPPVDMPMVQDYLAKTSPILVKGISDDINNKLLFQIIEGVKVGESYDRINDRLKNTITTYNDGIPKTVHKVVHEAMMTARLDEMGDKAIEKVLWITTGDSNVRPEHTELEGMSPIPDKLAREHAGDWACRCTVAEIDILTELRLKNEGEI